MVFMYTYNAKKNGWWKTVNPMEVPLTQYLKNKEWVTVTF
jgi:hypothetical protein